MHNIVLSEQYGMPDGLNYESTHIQMSYILYFFKISKLPTLKELLPGRNQHHASSKTP